MITYQRSQARTVAVIAAGVAVLGGLAYWFMSSGASDQREGVVLSSASSPMDRMVQTGFGANGPALNLHPPITSDGRPSDVQPDDWLALKNALAKIGMPENAAGNLVALNRYQKGFESWQALDEEKEAGRRKQMAAMLLADLPDRVANGEFSLIESMLMGASLIADVEHDEARRNQQLETWQGKVTAVVPVPQDDAQSKSQGRETEYKRRQAEAFAQWQSQSDALARTPAKLEQAMEEVRRAYNAQAF